MAKKPTAKKKNDRPKTTGRGKILDAKAAQQQAQRDASAKAEGQTLRMPEQGYLDNLRRRTKSLKASARAASGQAGEMIRQGVDTKHLDRKAFAIARGLDDMDDAKLRITYRHLMKYLDDLGVTARATAQMEMFDEGGDEDGDGEETPASEASGAEPGTFREGQRARNEKNQDRSSAPLPAAENFEQPAREVAEESVH